MARRGRKSKGPTRNLSGQPLSLRMPPDLRKRLETSAKKKGRSLTQEALLRLMYSYNKERSDRRDPSVRALCYLVGECAAGGDKWLTDPFDFQAFRSALFALLSHLEPQGPTRNPDRVAKMLSPYAVSPADFGRVTGEFLWANITNKLRLRMKAGGVSRGWKVETTADGEVKVSGELPEEFKGLASSELKDALAKWRDERQKNQQEIQELVRERNYAMEDAARDLLVARESKEIDQ